jgi:GT2 family glycosyltransferase
MEALGRQTVAASSYELVVVVDGSTDGSYEQARGLRLPCEVQVLRHETNKGVSAGRNLAIRNARGRYLIFVSDDLIVPEGFIQAHVRTLEQYPRCWVVGGFQQLATLRDTPFGRYLDDIENELTERRKTEQIAPDLWEMVWPTARNLSLPKEDLERTGVFDERFRTTCEDQDLVHRARPLGIRFLYNAAITCIHNDQAGDLDRYCRFQERGARDTVLFVAKFPDIHGSAPIARMNGPIDPGDEPALVLRKKAKAILSTDAGLRRIRWLIAACEACRLPERLLRRLYRLIIGLHIFRGWREGLRSLEVTGARRT